LKNINVFSEIGKLKKVLVHRPGKELENLTPQWLELLLFDDIPWLELAQKEHDVFAQTFRDNDIEVYYLEDLIAETLDQDIKIKNQFIDQFLQEAHVSSETLFNITKDYLHSYSSTKEMVLKTMAGVYKNDIPKWTKRTLLDYVHEYPFVTSPMPNLYFTRDPFSSIGNGVAINKMYTHTRFRETIYCDYILRYHKDFKKEPLELYFEREFHSSIEGGDILVLSDKILAIGISQRTHPTAIEHLAKNVFFKYNTSFDTILAFDIPKERAFMHLDTLFTQVDYGKFTMHQHMHKSVTVYEITKDKSKPGKLHVKQIQKLLKNILVQYLKTEITLIPCGGDNTVAADREQWSDGANTVAIAPGEVIVYQRNHITNDILVKNGVFLVCSYL